MTSKQTIASPGQLSAFSMLLLILIIVNGTNVYGQPATLIETQVLKSSNPTPDEEFGRRLALDGNTAAITASRTAALTSNSTAAITTNNAKNDGRVDLFKHENGIWTLAHSIHSPNPQDLDFPKHVAIDGDTLLVGVYLYDEPSVCDEADPECNTGVAYIFDRNTGGANLWGHVATLNGGHTPRAKFGQNLSLDGDTAVIAAYQETGPFDFSGAVYVFERNAGDPGQWELIKRLEDDNPGELMFFGQTVIVKDDTLVALSGGDNSISVFERDSGGSNNWGRVQKIETVESHDFHLAFDGTTIVSGRDDGIMGSNTLFFYEKNDSNQWILVQSLEDTLDVSGLALESRQLVLTEGDSIARLYERNDVTEEWGLVADFTASSTESPSYTTSSAIHSGRVLVGLGWQNNNEGVVLAYETSPPINAGHAGAWFNPATSGQGQLIDVEPEKSFMFLSWFTFTDAGSVNAFEQRWFTAQGNYTGSKAELILYETLGGRFDDPREVITNPVGEVTLSFSGCGQGQMSYRIEEEKLQGAFPMLRVIPGSGNVCEGRAENTLEAVDINAGMDGAWFDTNTPGQGYFIDAHPDPDGGNFIFVAWFTYGEVTASGQRWLTAQGSFEGSTAEIDVYETTGGSFNDPLLPSTDPAGSMNLNFTDCSNALLTYSLTEDGAEGSIAISRAIPGAQELCEELALTD